MESLVDMTHRIHQSVNVVGTLFGERSEVYYGVSEEKLIRVEALKRILAARGIPADKMAAFLATTAANGGKSYWSGVLGGHRSFGEKAARSVEESLELPRGALDDLTPERLAEQPPEVRRPIPVVTTPEESVLLSYFRELSLPRQRWLMEQAIRLKGGAEPWPQAMVTIIGLIDSLPAGEQDSACKGIESWLQERIEHRWREPEPEGKGSPASDHEGSPPPAKLPRASKK